MTSAPTCPNLLSRLRGFARAQGGMAAVEFAVILPFMLTAYLGGVEIGDGVAIDRKVAITTRAVADLASRYTKITDADMTTILGASSTIIAPYASGPLAVTVSGVTVDNRGNATIDWSNTLNGTAHTKGSRGDPSGHARLPGRLLCLGRGQVRLHADARLRDDRHLEPLESNIHEPAGIRHDRPQPNLILRRLHVRAARPRSLVGAHGKRVAATEVPAHGGRDLAIDSSTAASSCHARAAWPVASQSSDGRHPTGHAWYGREVSRTSSALRISLEGSGPMRPIEGHGQAAISTGEPPGWGGHRIASMPITLWSGRFLPLYVPAVSGRQLMRPG